MFHAGVSTAEAITDISGRGVGMDVVKQSIETAGGRITVQTSAGKGSLFTIYLPKAVSTQIVESLVVQIDKQCFVVPLERVHHVFQSDEVDVFSTGEAQEFIFRDGIMLPIVPAATLLKTSEAPREPMERRTFVSVQSNDRSYAVWIDDILAVQQIVIKKVPSLDASEGCFSGAALSGDGRIALLIDIDRLCLGYDRNGVALKGIDVNNAAVKKRGTAEDDTNTSSAELLLTRSNGSTLAFQLANIARLDRIQTNLIEYNGGIPCLQRDGSIVPVVHDLIDAKSVLLDGNEVSVLIATTAGATVAVLVDEIIDVIDTQVALEEFSKKDCIAGTAIIRGVCTDIVDLESLVAQAVV
jgi:two-component system chemotaxis sensor kinase CheA